MPLFLVSGVVKLVVPLFLGSGVVKLVCHYSLVQVL